MRHEEYFKDKVAIVTGASSGIGLATAARFARCGAKVVMAARSLDRLHELEQELSQYSEVMAVKTDVTNEDECKALVEAAVKRFGKIDILINNAGISMRALFKDLDLSVIHRLMDVNFWGTVYCTKYALPYLLESKGSIVGVISTAGYKGLPARTGYSASKFAVNGFLDTLRCEHLYDGLHVMIFAPGFTSSEIRRKALNADGSQQGDTPRNESGMMSADKVAHIMLRCIRRRKWRKTLTAEGHALLILTRLFPRLTNYMEYMFMANEPDSPLMSKKEIINATKRNIKEAAEKLEHSIKNHQE